jgi:hypothetical protein
LALGRKFQIFPSCETAILGFVNMKPITLVVKSIGLETRKSFAYISQYWKKEVDRNRFFPQRSYVEKIVGDRDTTRAISVSPPQEMNFDCQLLKNQKIVCSQAFPGKSSNYTNIRSAGKKPRCTPLAGKSWLSSIYATCHLTVTLAMRLWKRSRRRNIC